MQCANCGFENLPGLAACARCMSTLCLDAFAVEPPRAGRGRLRTRGARWFHRWVGGMPDFRAWWRQLRIVIPEPLDWRALAWSFIPGLGHLKTRRTLGQLLLPAWLLLFACTLLTLGSTLSWWFLTAMIAVHALAVTTLFASNLAYERTVVRAVFGLLLFFSLQFLVYQPSVWFCSRFVVAVPIQMARGGEVVQAGDGLLCEGAWLRPEQFARGDIVLYSIDDMYADGFIIRSGSNVDRVIGIPGDHVRRAEGVLTVNGEPVPPKMLPIGDLPALGPLDLPLGPGQYAIFTTVGRMTFFGPARPQLPPYVARHLTVVNDDHIVGRVLYRIRPWSRIGRIGQPEGS